MLLQRWDQGEVGLVTLQHDFLHGGILCADNFGCDGVAGFLGVNRCSAAMIIDAQRPGHKCAAGGEVAHDLDVADFSVGEDRFIDDHDGSTALLLQRVLQRRDLVHRRYGMSWPKNSRLLSRQICT